MAIEYIDNPNQLMGRFTAAEMAGCIKGVETVVKAAKFDPAYSEMLDNAFKHVYNKINELTEERK